MAVLTTWSPLHTEVAPPHRQSSRRCAGAEQVNHQGTPPHTALGLIAMDFWCFNLCLSGLSDGKQSACNAGDPGSIPGSGRSSGEGNGNPLQYSCLEHAMDRGACWATVCEVAESQTRLSESVIPPECVCLQGRKYPLSL